MARRMWMPWFAFAALVLEMVVPAVAQAQDDPTVAVMALLPPGYTVTYTRKP